MPALPSNNAQSEVKAILDLNDLLMSDGVLRDVKITDVLRVSVASQVFRIKHQGQIFILKRYVHENAVRSVENIMRELPISAEVLHNNHSHHVNKLVMGRPDLGLVLLEYCKGKTLGTHLRTSDIGKQKRLMRAAGDWLKAYTQPRICEKKFAPSFWTLKWSYYFGQFCGSAKM